MVKFDPFINLHQGKQRCENFFNQNKKKGKHGLLFPFFSNEVFLSFPFFQAQITSIGPYLIFGRKLFPLWEKENTLATTTQFFLSNNVFKSLRHQGRLNSAVRNLQHISCHSLMLDRKRLE